MAHASAACVNAYGQLQQAQYHFEVAQRLDPTASCPVPGRAVVYSDINAMLSRLHMERVAAGARAAWHDDVDEAGMVCGMDDDDDL